MLNTWCFFLGRARVRVYKTTCFLRGCGNHSSPPKQPVRSNFPNCVCKFSILLRLKHSPRPMLIHVPYSWLCCRLCSFPSDNELTHQTCFLPLFPSISILIFDLSMWCSPLMPKFIIFPVGSKGGIIRRVLHKIWFSLSLLQILFCIYSLQALPEGLCHFSWRVFNQTYGLKR